MEKAKLYFGLTETMPEVYLEVSKELKQFYCPHFINAENYRYLDRYFWMGATKKTDVIVIYKCPYAHERKFNIEWFYNSITEGVQVENKGQKPFTIYPKLIFATEHPYLVNRKLIPPIGKAITDYEASFNRRFDVKLVFKKGPNHDVLSKLEPLDILHFYKGLELVEVADVIRYERYILGKKAETLAKRKLKKGDRVSITKCPGTKRTFTFDHWDGHWMVSKSGINDYAPIHILLVNGMPLFETPIE